MAPKVEIIIERMYLQETVILMQNLSIFSYTIDNLGKRNDGPSHRVATAKDHKMS